MVGTFLPNKNGIFLQYLIVCRCKSFTFVVTGSMFLYSTGNLQLLCTTDMEMLKEIGLHKSLSLGKPSYLTKDRGPLLGQGILSSSGPIWSHQRKIIAPEFFPDKVKVRYPNPFNVLMFHFTSISIV